MDELSLGVDIDFIDFILSMAFTLQCTPTHIDVNCILLGILLESGFNA